MHDQHYKAYSYRLSETTKENLSHLRHDSELSYNLLFANMIKHYIQKKINKKNKYYKSLVDSLPKDIPYFK